MKINGVIAALMWGVSSPLWAQEALPVPPPPPAEAPVEQVAVAAPLEATFVPTTAAVELEKARAQLAAKDELIAKLSRHLESALARLNRSQSPVGETNTSLSALRAAKAQLENQNILLRQKQTELSSQVAELSRQKQLLDLENRQLFQALNGRPVVEGAEPVMQATQKKSLPAAKEKQLVLGY